MKTKTATLVTLGGNVIPALLGLYYLPILNQSLGASLFGFFMLAWASVGISSFLDLGLGKSVVYYSSGSTEKDRVDKVNSALLSLFVVSIVMTFVFAFVVVFVFKSNLFSYNSDYFYSVMILVFSLPFAINLTGYRGVLEGKQLFTACAVLRSVSGVLFILIPAWLALYFESPEGIAIGFLVARASVFYFYKSAAVKFDPLASIFSIKFCRESLASVFGYSFWVSLSGVVGAVLGYLDRIALALFSNLSSAGYYSAPFEIISRLLLIPGAIVTVIFPRLSAAVGDNELLRSITKEAYLICLAGMLPIVFFIFVYSEGILIYWMGADFAVKANLVVKIAAVGVLFNALAHIPLAVLQATGAPRLAARIHLVEIIPFVVFFSLAAYYFGANGVAIVWSLRVFVDFLLMVYFANRVDRVAN